MAEDTEGAKAAIAASVLALLALVFTAEFARPFLVSIVERKKRRILF